MSHPVHPFVKPFTCVAQTVWMGAGQRLRGRGGRGPWGFEPPGSGRDRVALGRQRLGRRRRRPSTTRCPSGVGWGGGHADAVPLVSFRRRTRDGGAGLDLPRLLLEPVELEALRDLHRRHRALHVLLVGEHEQRRTRQVLVRARVRVRVRITLTARVILTSLGGGGTVLPSRSQWRGDAAPRGRRSSPAPRAQYPAAPGPSSRPPARRRARPHSKCSTPCAACPDHPSPRPGSARYDASPPRHCFRPSGSSGSRRPGACAREEVRGRGRWRSGVRREGCAAQSVENRALPGVV